MGTAQPYPVQARRRIRQGRQGGQRHLGAHPQDGRPVVDPVPAERSGRDSCFSGLPLRSIPPTASGGPLPFKWPWAATVRRSKSLIRIVQPAPWPDVLQACRSVSGAGPQLGIHLRQMSPDGAPQGAQPFRLHRRSVPGGPCRRSAGHPSRFSPAGSHLGPAEPGTQRLRFRGERPPSRGGWQSSSSIQRYPVDSGRRNEIRPPGGPQGQHLRRHNPRPSGLRPRPRRRKMEARRMPLRDAPHRLADPRPPRLRSPQPLLQRLQRRPRRNPGPRSLRNPPGRFHPALHRQGPVQPCHSDQHRH